MTGIVGRSSLTIVIISNIIAVESQNKRIYWHEKLREIAYFSQSTANFISLSAALTVTFTSLQTACAGPSSRVNT